MAAACTEDGRYAERRRRATEMMAAWVAEDAADALLIIDLRGHHDNVVELRPVKA